MLLDSCPPRDELRLFLNEQLDALRQTTLEWHIDRCRSCQETLDELTQEDAYNLPGRSTEPMTMTQDSGAPAAEASFPSSGNEASDTVGTKEETRNDLCFQLDSDSKLDQQGTSLLISTDETNDGQEATDPNEAADSGSAGS
jgi:hypothetical protein